MSSLILTNLELRALLTSSVISIGVSFLSILIGFFLAIPTIFYRVPGRRLFPFLFLVPLLIPPYLHAFAWMHTLMFLGDYKILGLTSSRGVEILSSLPGIIAILTLAYFPIAFFIIRGALRNIPQEMLDAASQVAPPARALRRIIIPAILPATLTAGLLTFIVSFITFDVPALLGKNVFVTQIFKSFTFTSEVGRALYLSSIPTLIVGVVWAILLTSLVKGKPFFSLQSSQEGRSNGMKLPRPLNVLIFFLFVVVVLVSSVLPIGVLQIKNLLYEPTPFYTASSSGVIINTLWISFVASVCIVVFSAFVYFTIFRHLVGRILVLSLFVVPPVTFGILFIYLFNRPALALIYQTPVILILAYCLRFAPLVCELFYSHEKSVNPQYLEAARLTRPLSLRLVNEIVLPLYMPVLFLAWMFSFWLVATELPITLLVQPAGFQTIITRLFIVLHYGAEELMSLMTLSLLTISLLPILAIYFIFGKNLKNG